AGNSITWKTGRYDAGIVLKTGFCKHIESPKRILDDRKIRRTISLHRHSDDLFEKIFGATDIGEKFLRRLSANFQMPVSVTRHFMPISLDLLDNLRKTFSELTEHKQSGPHVGLA